MRPLPLDVLYFLLPLLVGGLLFAGGRTFLRWPWPLRAVVLVAALGLVVVGGLVLARAVPLEVGDWFAGVGGATVVLAWVAQLLLGAAWDVPGRRMSGNFLVALAVLAGVLIAVAVCGPLWWRFGDQTAWSRTVNEQGMLQQSSGATCGPAAAVMLLARHGIPATEGEMAYLAGTSPFGSDAPGLVRALQRKAGPLGWRVVLSRPSYDEAISEVPFLAHIAGSMVGHAVLVDAMTPSGVILADPAYGQWRTLWREEFEREWDRTAIRLVRAE